ncbi:unnamed protein product [Medioppia subpectinata]|uniref:Uncharacterized protein n=1 Tax=Medioppia subpectinata TaxID=1979941 RepID=A0A7R9PZG3_9ACAR|nr:unnamed protein product [Medioppia subpectinata]CAG2107060.1 unnamed protein product [Medioppia subpectinata]
MGNATNKSSAIVKRERQPDLTRYEEKPSRMDPERREMMARVMETSMEEVITSKEMAEVVTHTVVNEVVVINGNTYETRVPIEADIEFNTHFHVLSDNMDYLTVKIIAPSGVVYSTTSDENAVTTLDFTAFRLYLESTQSGLWIIKLIKETSEPVVVNVMVECIPIGAQAIELQVFVREPEDNYPPLITCKLCKGNDPIVGAIVTATVDRPGGTQTDIPLNLYHNSGYYYAYFTDYSGAGRYNVSALAVNDGKNTTYHGAPIGQFRRQLMANSFQVMADSMSTNTPPDDRFNKHLLSRELSQQKKIIETVPKRVSFLSDQMKVLKAKLATNYIRTKRAVRGLQLQNEEKSDLVMQLMNIKLSWF